MTSFIPFTFIYGSIRVEKAYEKMPRSRIMNVFFIIRKATIDAKTTLVT
ncbi:hypothetical protein [Pseudoneobacillus rhizosphaerae]|nr:hypothetical protein [Pseudoneobacillus rhizosphaerae]